MTLLAAPSDRAIVPLRTSVVRPLTRPIWLARHITATQAGYLTSAFIVLGIMISVVTTPDPLWWQQHFSRLGTFAVFSGYTFNATIVVSGALVVYFATRLRVEMVTHAGSALLSNRRAATVVPVLVGVIGVHLSLVGMFPLNVNEFLHDRGPQGALLAFVVTLGSRKWMLGGMHPEVAKTTHLVGVALTLAIAGFVTGVLNLAAFELFVFSLIFMWFLMLARNIGRPVAAPAAVPAPARAVVVRRRPRRHVGLHAAPPQVIPAASAHPRQRSRARRAPNRSYAAAADSDHRHPGRRER